MYKRISVYALLIGFMSMGGPVFASFTYNDRPIAPNCLANLIDLYDLKHPTVKLAKCSAESIAVLSRVENDLVTTQDDMDKGLKPYASYSVLGEIDNKYLLSFGQWTGGSGYFTNIMWVEIKDNTISQIKVVSGGDRCNGGVSKSGLWQYSVNLTSADLLNFTNQKDMKITPYESLDSSAAGCVAKAHYFFNAETGVPRFMYVTLDKANTTAGDWSDQFVYQNCFNQLLTSYTKEGKHELSMSDIDVFAEKFKNRCYQKFSKESHYI